MREKISAIEKKLAQLAEEKNRLNESAAKYESLDADWNNFPPRATGQSLRIVILSPTKLRLNCCRNANRTLKKPCRIE